MDTNIHLLHCTPLNTYGISSQSFKRIYTIILEHKIIPEICIFIPPFLRYLVRSPDNLYRSSVGVTLGFFGGENTLKLIFFQTFGFLDFQHHNFITHILLVFIDDNLICEL